MGKIFKKYCKEINNLKGHNVGLFCIFKMGIARENEGNIESKG